MGIRLEKNNKNEGKQSYVIVSYISLNYRYITLLV